MYCSQCGYKLGEGMNFCPVCGKAVVPIEMTPSAADQTRMIPRSTFEPGETQMIDRDALQTASRADASHADTQAAASQETALYAAIQVPKRDEIPVASQDAAPRVADCSGLDVPCSIDEVASEDESQDSLHSTPSDAASEPPRDEATRTAAPSNEEVARKERRRKRIIIGVVTAVVVIAAVVIGVVVQNNAKAASEHARNATHHEVTVAAITAAGFDENSSRIPVQVTGTDGNGDAFDEQQFIDVKGKGLSLPIGDFTITILASPLTADGSLFTSAAAAYQITLPADLKEAEGYASDAKIELALIDPLYVTDGQIEAAVNHAKEDEDFNQSKIDEYKQAAINKRQEAIDTKAAEEAAAAAAAAQAAAEAKAAADAASITEHYKSALTKIMNSRTAPDGEMFSTLSGTQISDSKFAICDIDQDGVDELIVKWYSSSVNDYAGRVYEYSPDSELWTRQFSGTPEMHFFTNGYLRDNANHNQTYGAFWPCTIYRLSNNTYTQVYNVYSIDKSLAEKATGVTYPSDVDTEGAGTVYVVDGKNVSKSTFESGVGALISSDLEISVTYYSLTSSSIDGI